MIAVEDVNDNAPRFEQRSYRCVLSEDAKRGQFITMVTATDPDVADQTKLVYSLTGGNDQQMFNIDSKKGGCFLLKFDVILGLTPPCWLPLQAP